jgi:Major Facilitator Superfamily
VKKSSERWEVGPIAFLIAGLLFMENLDAAVIPTAAPTIARQFHILSGQVGICATAYLMAVVVLIPVSAWFVEKWGARPVLFTSIIIFTGASLLCAISTTLTELTFMRVIQGAGGAMMVPVGRLVVLRATDKVHMIRAISYLTWPALTAPIIAPALSGLIIAHLSWPWIFAINLPIGIIELILAIKLIPKGALTTAQKLDWTGFVGASISLGALVFGAAALGNPKVNTLATSLLLVTGIGLGIPTVRHMFKVPIPLVGLDALHVRTFRFANTAGASFRVGINAVPFLMPLMFQDKFGWSPVRAGSTVLFLFLGNFFFKPLTTPLLKILPFRHILMIATSLSGVSILLISALKVSTPLILIWILLLFSGSVRSLGYTCYNTITFADIDQPKMQQANSLASMIQQLTQVFAVAIAVLALKLGVALFGNADQFTFAFIVLAVLVFMAFVGSARLPQKAGDSIRVKGSGL